MKTLYYLFSTLTFFSVLFLSAQEDYAEEEDMGGYVPFAILMTDVINNVGQDRIDAIDRVFTAIEEKSTDPDYLSIPSLYFFKARELTFLGKYEEAGLIADKIREISPTIVSNLLPESRQWAYSLGFVADGFVSWIKKDIPQAKVYFDSANYYFKDGFYANYFLGWIAQNERDNQTAIDYYTKAENGVTVIKYDWSELYYKKGVIYHGMKLYNNAEQEYTKSIEKFPRCKVFYERGKVYYFSSTFPDKSIAYRDFQSIIDNCPNFKNLGGAYSFIAEEFYSKSQYQQAASNYKKAYELGGNFTDAGNVSMVYYVLKDWYNTITWASKAIDASRSNPNPSTRALGDYYFYRGYANWSLKKMDATVADLEQARRFGHQTADQYLREYFGR